MAKWWEQELDPQPTSRLRRPLDDQQFQAEQQRVDDELLARDRADDSQSQRALNQAGAQLSAAPRTVRGLARTLFGDEERGGQDLAEAQRIIDREAQYAPDVQSLEDIHDGGDALAYGRNAILSNLPTIIPTAAAALATGGTSAVGGAALRGLAQRGIAGAVGRGLTARAGATAGAWAASSALQSNQMLDVALDEESGDSARERAGKAVVGAVTTGALDALPTLSLLNRMGLGGAAKRAIAPQIQRSLAARLGKEAGKQALQEGSTEAVQSLGERLTHKWVNDNVEVLGPEAYSEYLNAAVAGALVGGAIGGAPALTQRGAPRTDGTPVDGARERVKSEWNWFKSKNAGPVPVETEAARTSPEPPSSAGAEAAPTADTGADLAETMRQSEAAVDATQETPPGFITALFGKTHDQLNDADDDSLIDDLEATFREIDKDGTATSDDIGLVGKDSSNFSFSRGIPFNGFSLFDAPAAQKVWENSQAMGSPISVGEAFARTSVPSDVADQMGEGALRAAGKYLLTGDRSMVDEDQLATYLKFLEPNERLQFIYAASRTAENIAKAREVAGPQEVTPASIRKGMDSQVGQPITEEQVDPQQAEAVDESGEAVDFETAQGMSEERPVPVSLNEVVGALPFVDSRGGAREGALRVTNSKGNPRDVSLASLVAQGWQAVKDGVISVSNNDPVVDVVAQALDVLQQRGLQVNPEDIRAGLWVGGKTKLTPAQAATIRNGMQPSRSKPVQETPGLPNVPVGERPYSNLLNESSEDQFQGEDGVENMEGVDPSLRPRTRSPNLAPRVSAEGRLTEAETIDTEAADNIDRDTRQLETDAVDTLNRASGVLGFTGPVKGKTLQDKIENFAERVASLRSSGAPLSKEQQAAIAGARRAIQRLERTRDDGPSAAAFDPAEEAASAARQRESLDEAQGYADEVPAELTAKPFTGQRRLSKKGEFADTDFDPDELIEAATAPIDLAREQSMLNALTDQLGLQRIKLRPILTGVSAYGQYHPRTREIHLSAKRSGNARLDTLLHELGHAVVIDSWTTLDRAQQDALVKDYQAWQMEAGRQRTQLGARKTRAPFFIKQWLDQNRDESRSVELSDLSQEQLEETLSFDEYLADQMAKALSQNEETRGTVHQFFRDLAAKLTELYEMFAGSKYEPAPTVQEWVQSLLKAQQAQVLHAQPLETQQVYADAADIDPPPAAPQQSPNASPANLFGLLSERDRGALEKALRDRGVFEQIYAAADEATQRQLNLYGPDLRVLINLGAALHAQGRIDLKAGKNVFQKLANFARTQLGLPSNQDVAQQILADHQAQQITKGHYDGEAKAFDRSAYTRNMLAVQRGVTRVVQPVMDKLTTDVGTRMRQTNNPALRKLATLFETRNAENAGEESFTSRLATFFSQHATAYMEAVEGLKDEQKRELARALQTYERPDGVLGERFDRVVKLLESYRLWANANGVEIKKRANYFPVVMDRAKVEAGWDELAALLSKPEYEGDIRTFFKDSKTGIGELVQRMVQIAQTADASHVGEIDFSTGEFAPSVTAQRQQIMGFITSKLDRPALAQFQSDSLDAIMLGYARQMSKKAAYRKVFGKATTRPDGSVTPDRIGQLMAAARQQGATPEQMKLARDFVNMMVGSYHAELNPAIRWVFQQVDKVWGSDLGDMPIEQWAHYQQVAQTYQNIRLLGLAALSSLIDPLGSLVRGGSVTDTLRSMRDGVRAMRADGNDLRHMAEALGIVEKYALSDAIAATYGGSFDPQGKLGKINNALFKYNGLEAVTRHSRLTALAMGHRFLIRHATDPNAHSQRLLQELGLTAEDVQVDPEHPQFVQLTPKTEAALRRFVTESVVRPQPSQRPGWHNDPNFMFAAQYKGYLYAFYTTVVDRMVKEAEAGNYRQALVPLIPYLGVTVAAEMVRYAVQHPDEEDPRDVADYMQLAMVRSGLVGPRFGVFNDARSDARYGSWLTNSWIGPSGQQVTDLVDVATGDRGFGKTAIEALPGSAIFEDWSLNNEQQLPSSQ